MLPAHPKFHLRPMHTDDLVHAEAIRAAVGWNQTEADWRRLLALAPDGCFTADLDGRPVGTVTTTAYGSQLAWIGMLLVHPDRRRQGIGRALLLQAISHLQSTGIDCIALDATPAGQPLYAGVGFTPVWKLARWQGGSDRPSSPLAGIQTGIPERAWPAVVALDCRAFGVARPALLPALAGQSSKVLLATGADADILGFGMIRRGAHAHLLGPVIAANAGLAADLVAALCAGAEPGEIWWDIPEPNTAAVQLATALGFRRQRSLVRMAYGAAFPTHDPQLLYGIADLATG